MEIDNQSTVFIVDDDPIGVEPLRILLEWHLGVEAVVCVRPQPSVSAFDPSRPGYLVLGIAMPESGEPEPLEDACPAVLPPTIILASHEPSSSVAHAVRAGTVDFLVKPVDPERLLSSVRKALSVDRRERGGSALE
jgi:FixJ family two-component response regulator